MVAQVNVFVAWLYEPATDVRDGFQYQVEAAAKLLVLPIVSAGAKLMSHIVIGDISRSLFVTPGMGLPCGYSMIPLFGSALLTCVPVVFTLNKPEFEKVPPLLIG